jgi:hypothetical protein
LAILKDIGGTYKFWGEYLHKETMDTSLCKDTQNELGNEMVPEAGFDLGEKQRLMALAAGRMDGGGLEPSTGSDESTCAKRMSNPGVKCRRRDSNPHTLTGRGFKVVRQLN